MPSYFLSTRMGECFRLTCAVLIAVSLTACSPALTSTRATRFIPQSPGDIREVNTFVVVDSWWGKNTKEARRVVHAVSEQWENEFGIRFPISRVMKMSVPSFTAMDQIRSLAARVGPDQEHQLIVLFSRSSGLLFSEASEVLGNYLVVAPGLWDDPEALFSHGLGHTFGASHHVAPNYLMSMFAVPFLSRRPFLGFSKGTRETIAFNKWRSFERVVPTEPQTAAAQ